MSLSGFSAESGLKRPILAAVQGVLSVVLALLLVVLYRDAVSPAFDYMGFTYREPDSLWLVCAVLGAGLLGVLMPQRISLPSDLFAWLFFVVVVVPSFTIPALAAQQLSSLLYVAMLATTSVALLFFVWFPRLPAYLLPALSLPPRVFWSGILILIGVCLLVLLIDFRAGLGRVLSLSAYSELYSLRYSYREQLASSFILSPYLLLWMSKVLAPMLFAWSIVSRQWLLAAAAVVVQLLLFSISGHKSFIFSLFLVAAVIWLCRLTYGGFWFLFGICGLVVLSAVLFYFFDHDQLINIIVRRALMVPGMLSGFYYEYFHNHGLALYSQNFLAGWTDSSYTKPPAFEVGYRYFGREETSSNVHFWADAFANLGYLAVITVTLLLGLMLLMINALSRTRQRLIIMALFTVPFWTLMESSLNTSLLSHGLLLALLLAVFVPAQFPLFGSEDGFCQGKR